MQVQNNNVKGIGDKSKLLYKDYATFFKRYLFKKKFSFSFVVKAIVEWMFDTIKKLFVLLLEKKFFFIINLSIQKSFAWT